MIRLLGEETEVQSSGQSHGTEVQSQAFFMGLSPSQATEGHLTGDASGSLQTFPTAVPPS